MSELVIRIEDSGNGGYTLSYAKTRKTVMGLHRMTEVQPVAKRLLELLNDPARTASRALAQHLWNQLATVIPPGNNELVIESNAEEILSLPWTLVASSRGDLALHCRAPRALPESCLLRIPRLLVALPSMESPNRTLETESWDGFEWRLSRGVSRNAAEPQRPEVFFADTVEALGARLAAGVDLAYLPVGTGSRYPTLDLGTFEVMAEPLARMLELSPPQVLVLGGPGAGALRFSGWLSGLAARVPSVVVVPDAAGTEAAQAGVAARRFLDRVLGEALSPAEVCRQLAQEALPPEAPLCIGGAARPWPEGPPHWREGWESQLDRTREADRLGGLLRKLKPPRPNLLAIWHGEIKAGLGRLDERLRVELEDEYAVVKVDLGWPDASPIKDPRYFARMYCACLELTKLDNDALTAALAKRIAEAGIGDKKPLLHMRHRVLSTELYDGRLNPDVLKLYVGWWRNTIAPRAPQGAALYLSLLIAAEENKQGWLIKELPLALKSYYADKELGQFALEGPLPPVQYEEVVTFLRDHPPREELGPEELADVAKEIINRTGGVYERVLAQLERAAEDPLSLLRFSQRRQQLQEPGHGRPSDGDNG